MAQPTPRQLAWRGRIESALRLTAPVLDGLLAAGDRLSRVVDREGLDAPAPANALPPAPRHPRVGTGGGTS